MALPSGYIQVGWIKSHGTEYINTLYNPNSDTKVILNATNNVTGTYCLFGARNNIRSSAYNTLLDRDDYGGSQIAINIPYNQPFKVEKNKNVIKINDTIVATHIEQTFICPCPIYVFGLNSSNTFSLGTKMTLLSLKIYDNETLVRDYVPAQRILDGEAGLYDLVNDVFYTNQGTGEFEVPQEMYCNIWLKVSENEVQRIKKVIAK